METTPKPRSGKVMGVALKIGTQLESGDTMLCASLTVTWMPASYNTLLQALQTPEDVLSCPLPATEALMLLRAFLTRIDLPPIPQALRSSSPTPAKYWAQSTMDEYLDRMVKQ
jgi:hypothetical protein